jgi:hypothetical protein
VAVAERHAVRGVPEGESRVSRGIGKEVLGDDGEGELEIDEEDAHGEDGGSEDCCNDGEEG